VNKFRLPIPEDAGSICAILVLSIAAGALLLDMSWPE